MIKSLNEYIKNDFLFSNNNNNSNIKIYFLLILIIINIIVNDFILVSILKSLQNSTINIISKKDKNYEVKETPSNIDPKYEFFQIKEVNAQINQKKLTYVETLSGGNGRVGNCLIILNNLINICEKIRCKNIIVPMGLKNVIKKPIFYKNYNITIFPPEYINRMKVDINLKFRSIFSFHSNEPCKHRLRVIRDEVFSNIPKYSARLNDLYIHIRSGDIFRRSHNKYYAQPPLCFYKKIINENKYNNIYILSNGHENPVVDKLLKLYPKIQFLHGSVEYAISVIVNAFNFVMAFSTFSSTLIWLNNNLKNFYIFGDNYFIPNHNKYKIHRWQQIHYFFIPKHTSYTLHQMSASKKYNEIMIGKWSNTKKQLNLMLIDNCGNNNFTSFDIKN